MRRFCCARISTVFIASTPPAMPTFFFMKEMVEEWREARGVLSAASTMPPPPCRAPLVMRHTQAAEGEKPPLYVQQHRFKGREGSTQRTNQNRSAAKIGVLAKSWRTNSLAQCRHRHQEGVDSAVVVRVEGMR